MHGGQGKLEGPGIHWSLTEEGVKQNKQSQSGRTEREVSRAWAVAVWLGYTYRHGEGFEGPCPPEEEQTDSFGLLFRTPPKICFSLLRQSLVLGVGFVCLVLST